MLGRRAVNRTKRGGVPQPSRCSYGRRKNRARGGVRDRGRHDRRSTKKQPRPQHHQQQPPPWQQQQQRRYPQLQQRRHPQHQQHDSWTSWVRPPHQQQCWSGAPHQWRQHIGEKISRISTSRARANTAARRSTSPQSQGQLGTRPHQRRRTIPIRHHLQKLMSRSTAPAPLPRGNRMNTAMDTRLHPIADLHHPQPAIHLRCRCHHRPNLTDPHRRRLPRNPTGALHPGIPRPPRHILCSQARFWGVLFRVIRVRTVVV